MELCRGGRDIRPKGKEFSVEFWNKTSGQTDCGLNCCNCLAVKGRCNLARLCFLGVTVTAKLLLYLH